MSKIKNFINELENEIEDKIKEGAEVIRVYCEKYSYDERSVAGWYAHEIVFAKTDASGWVGVKNGHIPGLKQSDRDYAMALLELGEENLSVGDMLDEIALLRFGGLTFGDEDIQNFNIQYDKETIFRIE